MYLVRHYAYAVLVAQLSHTCQFRACPHTSAGIVRIAQQQDSGTLVRQLFVQIVKVNLIAQLLLIIYKGIGHRLAAVVAYARIEAVVHRTLHYHLVARQCERLDDGGYGGHHARRVYDVRRSEVPLVTACKPSAHRLVVGIGHTCVSEYAVSHPALQRLGYGGIGLEVHVCHPEGYDIGSRSRVPRVGIGVTAGWRRKLITHNT